MFNVTLLTVHLNDGFHQTCENLRYVKVPEQASKAEGGNVW